MAEPKLESVVTGSKPVEKQQAPALEHEVECPRCHDVMTLCSDFDSLYYFCEECDFCLHTIKRNSDAG